MARGGNQKNARSTTAEQPNPEAEERRRLSQLAFSEKLLSQAPAKASSLALNPSKTVTKHHGRDILRKSNRKNRFLFSFPGLIAPVSGGKIGDLKNLGSKNPILYLDFPQGRMKLFGTIVYPKNRYLTLQFSKGGKNVMCEDYFDNMIVFSDAWWIGSKEENPEELQLSFPENMNTGQQSEPDFQGGAGSTSERVQDVNQTAVKHQSPIREFSDSESDPKDLIQTTATRQSARTSRKSYKFAESSSADDAFDLDANTESSDGEDKEIGASLISGNKDETEIEVTKVSEMNKSATKAKEGSQSSLVQATISTLFKKKEEKMAINTAPPPSSSKVSRKRLQVPSLEDKVDQSKVKTPRQKGKTVKEGKPGTKSTPRKKKPKVSDDEIEEISDDSSQDSSDEDWGA
ncbi:putative DNA-binding protein RHL1 [Helianthus annuus]|uniref:DNA-binding protein RHL1 n=1 Tax=Helianthus annuus TaxID=4232 RepID=A0A251SFQ2_HELAN|nr:DNA-binding protein RHL1 isoform X1 [Helianthus annuus]KAF5766468.1 putative DNA-binding protein RHL1 [Helianthus annuus]KAJ0452842.1 putative DNA-binding protein RHL1 [Helianthus annuus]KAJ0457866.1 putative DNA-binding protein RHL1 [Helianthus annuus]KAJ0474757.1 putative DNA-binding protein RHL1 [Helianthus annuus]KAJ0650311.1 putative DNA-binding protein RHL1 [Helianthus annuus]